MSIHDQMAGGLKTAKGKKSIEVDVEVANEDFLSLTLAGTILCDLFNIKSTGTKRVSLGNNEISSFVGRPTKDFNISSTGQAAYNYPTPTNQYSKNEAPDYNFTSTWGKSLQKNITCARSS